MNPLEITSKLATIVKWKIENFSELAARDDPKKRLHSNVFHLDYRLLLGISSDKDYSPVCLFIKNSGDAQSIKIGFKIGIKNGERIRESEGNFIS
jgi:hypothetical protein